MASQRRELGLADDQADLPVISTQSLASLRQPARALRQSRQEVEELRSEGASAETTARELSEQVEAGLAARGEKSLTEAMNRQGMLRAVDLFPDRERLLEESPGVGVFCCVRDHAT